jgi:hypothetical protein
MKDLPDSFWKAAIVTGALVPPGRQIKPRPAQTMNTWVLVCCIGIGAALWAGLAWVVIWLVEAM